MKNCIALGVLILFAFACSKNNDTTQLAKSNGREQPSAKVMIGFNQNWSFLPAFSELMFTNIKMLKPQMIRYPGGTVAHDWDWVSGRRSNAPATISHPVEDVREMAVATGAKMIVVLDIMNKTLDDQLAMLHALKAEGIAITHIELGNELYSNDSEYVTAFPTGSEYAARVAIWAPQIRNAFPGVKIASLLQCRTAKASNVRLAEWNDRVVKGTSNHVDAYTYHIYIPVNGTYETRRADYEAVAAATKTASKDLWITEYGNQNDISHPNYYRDLDSLASYVERQPKITIALNHLIVGNNKNKLTPDGSTFTIEGQLFLNRAASR